MATEQRRIAIVGASVGGLRCARTLASSGFDGTITVYESESTSPYDKPQLSKDYLSVGDPKLVPLPHADADLDLRLGTLVRQLGDDLTIVTESDTTTYDAVVLATGATPRWLPGVEQSHRIGVLRTSADADALRPHLVPGAHLVVIGGGYLGLEVAASARRRGATATVLEASDRILGRGAPLWLSEAVLARHASAGVEVVTSVLVEKVTEQDEAVNVRLIDGQILRADFVLIAVGADPNVGLARSADIQVDDGIVCNEAMQTNRPGVYAIGDCASFENSMFGRRMRLEHWTSAGEQGAFVARKIAGTARASSCAVLPYVWSDQFDLHLQFVGLPGDGPIFATADGGSLSLAVTDEMVVGVSGINAQSAVLQARKALRSGPVGLGGFIDSVLQNGAISSTSAVS